MVGTERTFKRAGSIAKSAREVCDEAGPRIVLRREPMSQNGSGNGGVDAILVGKRATRNSKTGSPGRL